jgi:hypothetical protein
LFCDYDVNLFGEDVHEKKNTKSLLDANKEGGIEENADKKLSLSSPKCRGM